MQKESISISTEDRPLYYDASRLLMSSHLSPSVEGLYSTTSEFGPEYRINEALKLNAQRLVGLSFKKKKYPATFFTKSQVRDPTSTVFRISYGDDAIPKAAEADYKSTMMKSKPFIPPEYKNFEDKPHQLPLFLKEKLYKTVKSRKIDSTNQEDSNFNPPADQLVESNMHTQSRGDFLPSLPSYRNAKQHGISVKDFGRSTLGFGTPVRAGELPDFPYFSPKARQQMKSDSVPVLMSNVFLTGGINPEGLAPQDEAAVEYIVTEYHSKTRSKPPTAKPVDYEGRTQTNSRSRLTKTAMTMSLARQNEKKKEWEEVLYKNGPKQGVDKFGTKLKATVGHLKTEREVKRKKVLSLLKTKNFNLFRPNTINNLHLLKDALLKE